MTQKRNTDKLDLKFKTFCSAKASVKRIQRQATEWGNKIFQVTKLTKDLYPEYMRNT